MNTKGQIGAGAVIGIFMMAIVGLTLLISSAQNVGDITSATTAVNVSYTMPANQSRIDLEGQEILNTPIVINATDSVVINSGNYTIDEVVSTTTGVKTISLRANTAEFAGRTINLSYQYGQDGYIDSSGGRSVASLIVVFFALAIAVVAMTPSMREKIFGGFK